MIGKITFLLMSSLLLIQETFAEDKQFNISGECQVQDYWDIQGNSNRLNESSTYYFFPETVAVITKAGEIGSDNTYRQRSEEGPREFSYWLGDENGNTNGITLNIDNKTVVISHLNRTTLFRSSLTLSQCTIKKTDW